MTTVLEGPGNALTRVVAFDRPIDLRFVLGPLVRGAGDPTMRVSSTAAIRASVTPDGPAAIEIRVAGAGVNARAWGPGADHLLQGLPALLGLDDDDTGFEPARHPVVAALARRRGRVVLGRTGGVWEALLPAMLEQRITGTEAWRNYRRLVRAHGAPAPGPLALWLAPAPATIAGLASWQVTALGIEPRRGALLRRIAREAPRYEALGDPDAVSVGDAHLSNVVTFALTGRPRGSDEEMLGLLAPWSGHRARVVRLLETSGIGPPRFGPRVAPRDLVRDLTPRR